jgi:hypothetical protein
VGVEAIHPSPFFCKWRGVNIMKTVKSFKELEKYIHEDIQKAVVDTLKNEVFELARDVVINHVQADVYDVYDPAVYRRRQENQGLIDEDNIVYEIEDDGTLVVWDIAKYNPYKNGRPIKTSFSTEKRKNNVLQTLIIDGYQNYQGDAPYALPRPFIENVGTDLSKGGKHYNDLDEAFEDGLKRHGINKKTNRGGK